MKKTIVILLFLILFLLTACDQNHSVESTEESAEISTAVLTLETEDMPEILFLYARLDYAKDLHYGYMLYYIEKNGEAYSANWQTDEPSPDEALKHRDEFSDITLTGGIEINDLTAMYTDFLEMRDKEMLRLDVEELDIDITENYWYSFYPDGNEIIQQLFYYYGYSNKKIDDERINMMVNQLERDSAFWQAIENWKEIYSQKR